MIKNIKAACMLCSVGLLSTGSAFSSSLLGGSVAEVNIVQQENTCKGVVKDETGESIIGASVLVKGTTNGTITNIDGNFTLSNLKKGNVIEVSYIGYKFQEIVWNGQAINIVSLIPQHYYKIFFLST